ncbi:MAG: DUF2111 domain-containing protein [Candidatus Methanoperedens sp.]|nr:DUF2111 domain-containing protein [Candidatus Methanoperedens sp.]
MVIAISKDSSAEELVQIAMAFHELLGLPVTMRSFNKKGVRIEKGKLLDDNYTGPVLEQVLQENCTIRTIPKSGAYSGIPVVASKSYCSLSAVVSCLRSKGAKVAFVFRR